MKPLPIIVLLSAITCGCLLLLKKPRNFFGTANEPAPEIRRYDNDDSGNVKYSRYVTWRVENDLIDRELLKNSERITSETDKQYLVEAALENHPKACFELATQKWPDEVYLRFGPSVDEGKYNLLEIASKSDAIARAHLGIMYLYSGNKMRHEKARDLLESSSLENVKIAQSAYIGVCSKSPNWADPATAYIIASMGCRYMHPQSIDGDRAWKLRDLLAKWLTTDKLKLLLSEVDKRLASVNDPNSDNLMFSDDLPPEVIKSIHEMEANHRKSFNLY